MGSKLRSCVAYSKHKLEINNYIELCMVLKHQHTTHQQNEMVDDEFETCVVYLFELLFSIFAFCEACGAILL